LLHPVHGGRAIVHFTDFVVHAGIEKNALGRGGLAGVDVRRNTDIAVALNGGIASHDGSLVDQMLRGCRTMQRGKDFRVWPADMTATALHGPAKL